MNEHTEAVLDYAMIRRELQSYTVTPMGQALAAQLHPHAEAGLVDMQLRETSEMSTLLAGGSEPPLSPVVDVHPYLTTARIAGFYLEGTQLLEVAECLEVVQRLRRYAQGEAQRASLVGHRLARLADFGLMLRQFRTALDDKGQVRDQASPALQQIRHTLRRVRERIQRSLRDLMATNSSVVQDAIVTIRNNRFVIPLKTDFRQALRGIVHGESSSGATVYVEPESTVELNNQLLHVQAEEEREVREVLRQLTERFATQGVAFEQALQILGEVDLLLAKGRLSRRMQGTAPHLTSQRHLLILAARHPLLTAPLPIDIRLGPESRTLIITGPNTGGKTAALKTVGLLTLMAQSGLHIPAHPDSILPLYTEVFVDVGDEQSLEQNLSTFSAHLANIRTMMEQVSSTSLVLLDELGSGTDPMEGGPLGVAILEYFHHRGAMTIVTTHHSALKAYAMSAPQMACAAVDFDPDTLQPHYRLIYGIPGRSKAFVVAEKLGLPETVITRAQQEAGMTQVRTEQLLERLEIARQAVEDERQSLHGVRLETTRLHTEAQQTLAQAVVEERRIRESLYHEGQTLLKTARQELDTTLAALRRHASVESTVTFPHEEWQRLVHTMETLAPVTTASPGPPPVFQVGEVVKVRGLNIVGRLRTPVTGHQHVQVEVGNKTITVAAAELERAEAPPPSTAVATAPRPPRPRRRTSAQEAPLPAELFLLGSTVDEALPAVEQYLDQAFTGGLPRVRIIHGIGSGRLREAITELLSHHPLVRRFQAGDTGGGTTIVELEG